MDRDSIETDGGGPGEGLSEAQIAAIEGAFAEHDRVIARLRRELDELRERPPQAPAEAESAGAANERLDALEARLDQHEQALRRMLEKLIGFFEREGPGQPAP